ncbi:Bug family tripartite tricarboxylate transporter substrate binding protein [Ottowia thiooxydans]|uniref:Bug family tripartite tricarboxylate transporter substrate binding protein n=1 Tax=Ottowia thiooxydans TaxID=219182 RepID=UPI00040EE8CF|nr:tripartite tricarboxylate transporter substrate binding protein [Ottowia thiooxydans]
MVYNDPLNLKPLARAEDTLPEMNRRSVMGWMAAAGTSMALMPGTSLAQMSGDVFTLLVPFAPGSPPDVFSRLFADKLSKRMGRPVVVSLKPGASTTIGTTLASRSKPDGQMMLYATNSSITAAPGLFKKLQYDPEKDFSAVTVMLESVFCILVRPEDARLGVEGLAKRIRANPPDNGMGGGSTTAEVAHRLFEKAIGVSYPYARYNSNTLYTDLMGKVLHAAWCPMSTALNFGQKNNLHIMAITGGKRLPQFPNIPTIAETFPTVAVDSWSGFFVPSGTPRPIVDKLWEDVHAVLLDPEIVERGKSEGNRALNLNPQQSDEYVKKDFPKWRALFKSANIEPA